MDESLNKIRQLFDASRRILIIGHKKPDGDACGSILALQIYLSGLGKTIGTFVSDEPPVYFNYLPYFEEIKADPNVFAEPWDLIVFVDSGDIGHTGVDLNAIAGIPTVNIDHHFSNAGYGYANLVVPCASSTCEIIYRLLRDLGADIDRRIANCLLTGILSDTGGFSNAATSLDAMAVASDLTKRGGKIYQIFNHSVKNKSLNGLKLWGQVFSRIRINRRYNIAYTYITADDFSRFGVSEEELDGIANFLNVITDVNFSLVLHLDKEKTKVSLRTTCDDIDLSRLAGYFGGGGHKKAVGFTVPWEISEINGSLIVCD